MKGDGRGNQGGGRKKGTPNKVTAERRELINQFLTDKWDDFVDMYESGTSISEIAKSKNLSARTIYRYKAYYEKMKEATKE